MPSIDVNGEFISYVWDYWVARVSYTPNKDLYIHYPLTFFKTVRVHIESSKEGRDITWFTVVLTIITTIILVVFSFFFLKKKPLNILNKLWEFEKWKLFLSLDQFDKV